MNRPAAGRLAGLFITAFWVVMTALLLMRHYGPPKPPVSSARGGLPQTAFGEHWFGVYQKDRRIGYSSWNFRQLDKGYSVENTLKLRLRIMDTTRAMEVKTSALLDGNMVLESFEMALKADLDLQVSGTVKADYLKLLITSAGVHTEKSIHLKDRPVLDISMSPSLAKNGLKPGERREMTIFDPASLSLQPVTLTVEAGGPVQAMGRVYETLKVKGSSGGGDFTLWVTGKGEVLRQENQLGFTLVRETREEALRTEAPSIDMAGAAAVPINITLPEEPSFLRVRVSGIDFRGLDMDGGRQTLRGDVLEIRREDLSKYAGRRTAAVAPEYLGDSIFIQAKDSRIGSLSREITKGEKDPLRASRLINTWVYLNLEKTPFVSVPISQAVLKAARGDCNEHAVLFASLARAAGIPSRIALGLVHQKGRFYYHAWNEVHAGTWIAADPTLGQFPADAAHIRLLAGDLDRQTAIAGVIGKIRLQGLSFR